MAQAQLGTLSQTTLLSATTGKLDVCLLPLWQKKLLLPASALLDVIPASTMKATKKGKKEGVKWTGQSLGYIDETNNAAQSLTFLIVDVNLKGTYTPGRSSNATTPVECNTTGDGKCTSSITTTKCFTQDYINCINNTAATGSTAITISGSINCNAENVIPQ